LRQAFFDLVFSRIFRVFMSFLLVSFELGFFLLILCKEIVAARSNDPLHRDFGYCFWWQADEVIRVTFFILHRLRRWKATLFRNFSSGLDQREARHQTI